MNKNINNKSLVPEERIEQIIFIIRNQKVILDSDLAALYGVETGALNRAVKRNIERFPLNFMFQLTKEEAEDLRSRCQIGILNEGPNSRFQFGTLKRGSNIKFLPYAFTEHGALMAATILNSPRAVAMSLAIINTFIKLRQMLSVNKDLSHRLDELEKRYDENFHVVFDAIRELMAKPEEPERAITGFK